MFTEYKPSLVFHAAAHKHVPLMENNPLEAIKNNIFGTYNVVNCADEYEVEKFERSNIDYANTNKATAKVWLKFYPYVEGIANLMRVIMLAVGGGFLIHGSLTMGE